MSELIDNGNRRKQELAEIIESINANAQETDPRVRATRDRALKRRFTEVFKNLAPEEIAQAEQALVEGGMPVQEVQKLCEVHVEAFSQALHKGALKQSVNRGEYKMSGHPIRTYRDENKALKNELKVLAREIKHSRRFGSLEGVKIAFDSVRQVETHYARKENQLFPFLERVGFTGPSKVMWGKHDEIRVILRDFDRALETDNREALPRLFRTLSAACKRMIFMEERILFPTAARKLPQDAWAEIRRGENAIGFAWIKRGSLWDPDVAGAGGGSSSGSPDGYSGSARSGGYTVGSGSAAFQAASAQGGADSSRIPIPLSTGSLEPYRIDLMLKNLPVDLSYVDEFDLVRYYSDNPHRVFPRSPGVIGRAVQNCHPASSVHIVQQILDDFRAGIRDHADFWIQMKGMFIHIRYFALYEGGTYKGCLEVSQDVTAIRALEGEKRLDG